MWKNEIKTQKWIKEGTKDRINEINECRNDKEMACKLMNERKAKLKECWK